jgi:phosphatidylserine/phosphatidylglycerophosphate/cardiolipin synthase-like enzyme
MTDGARGLSSLPEHELVRLRDAAREHKLTAPLTSAGLHAAGFGRYTSELIPTLVGLSLDAIVVVADVALAERAHRKPPHLRLVWTGPEGEGTTARETEALVSDLFTQARHEVLIAGFRFDHGKDMFAPLYTSMRDRGVVATVFLDVDIPGEAKTTDGTRDYAERAIDRFYKHNWPFGDPRPTVYYDPRTALPGPPWASLHAKCVVVDEQRTFITSANFTERGHERNIELGVLIIDSSFAAQVVEQWRALVTANLLRTLRT